MSVLVDYPPGAELGQERAKAVLPGLSRTFRLRRTGYIPWDPTPTQGALLWYDGLEAFYGGAAGGGKSVALLMAALQYVDVPGYAALIVRRTLEELRMPGALIDLSRQWLAGTDARWNGNEHKWTFPSGATLGFGYLKNPGSETRYQSAAFQFIGFDELTAFLEGQYSFLFSRLRKPDKPTRGRAVDGVGISDVPLRIRSASNPGGDGHEWVKELFVEPSTRRSPFFPAKLEDNPHLDRDTYLAALAMMTDPITRMRMEAGDWDVLAEGTRFHRDWFEIVDRLPSGASNACRHWDLAATEPSPAAPDPDYTVGTHLLAYPDGSYVVEDVQRMRVTSAKVELAIKTSAREDGRLCVVGLEQEPGSSGKLLIEDYQRRVLRGYSVKGIRPTGDKFTRAGPAASAAEQGRVKVLRAEWNRAWLNELCLFTQNWKGHDDQVDSFSGAFDLAHHRSRPRGRKPRADLPASMLRPGMR